MEVGLRVGSESHLVCQNLKGQRTILDRPDTSSSACIKNTLRRLAYLRRQAKLTIEGEEPHIVLNVWVAVNPGPLGVCVED
jgi:hypothetical protein